MLFGVISLFAILQMYSLIRPSLSSCFLKFGEKSAVEEYKRSKSASVHRGVILSWSPVQKHAMCQDIFNFDGPIRSSEEITARMVISDFPESDVRHRVDPQYPIFLRKTVETVFSEPEWNLSFTCYGKHFQKKGQKGKSSVWYHIYTAFYPKWLYSAHPIVSMDNSFTLRHFITLSPDYVDLQQSTLEKYYVNTQVTLMTLREESPEYVDRIMRRSDLLILTRLQKFHLCASILSTPVYRQERLEFSFDWMGETADTLEEVNKPLSLTSTPEPKDEIKVPCIPCKAFENGTDPNSKSETLYLAPTYDNDYSVVVLKENDGRFYVDKYFQNIAILITLFERMDYAKIIPNFSKPELAKESKQN